MEIGTKANGSGWMLGELDQKIYGHPHFGKRGQRAIIPAKYIAKDVGCGTRAVRSRRKLMGVLPCRPIRKGDSHLRMRKEQEAKITHFFMSRWPRVGGEFIDELRRNKYGISS